MDGSPTGVGSPLVDVRNLRVRYPIVGRLRARLEGIPNRFLDAVLDVSFTMRRGTTLALVGESGSGKSTLGRAIMGLVPIAAGSIQFEGADVGRLSGRERKDYYRNVAMMFQDPISSLSPRRDVGALITEPFVIHGMNKRDLDAEARRLLALVGLPTDFANRYPHQLSGGQARRVGVARALAHSPKLIIADEPTAGLDVSVQGEVLNLMTRLQAELGLTYLMITHNLAVVRHVSDETAVMYMGRLVEMGSTHEIFGNPAHPYTACLIDAQSHPDPDRHRRKVTLLGEVPSLLRRPTGCEFHTRCPGVQDICSQQFPDYGPVSQSRANRCHFPLHDARDRGSHR